MSILLWIVVIFQLVIIFFLTRFVVDFLNRVTIGNSNIQQKMLQVGDKIPGIRHKNIIGEKIMLPDEGSDQKNILAFVNSNCALCRYLVEVLLSNDYRFKNYKIILIVPENNNLNFFGNYPDIIVSPNLISNYLVNKFPTVYFTNSTGTIINVFVPKNEEQISELLIKEIAV